MVKKKAPVRTLHGPEFKPNRSRIDMVVPVDIRELLVEASQVVYESLTGFIIHAAVDRARKIIHDEERIKKAEEALRRMPYVRL